MTKPILITLTDEAREAIGASEPQRRSHLQALEEKHRAALEAHLAERLDDHRHARAVAEAHLAHLHRAMRTAGHCAELLRRHLAVDVANLEEDIARTAKDLGATVPITRGRLAAEFSALARHVACTFSSHGITRRYSLDVEESAVH